MTIYRVSLGNALGICKDNRVVAQAISSDIAKNMVKLLNHGLQVERDLRTARRKRDMKSKLNPGTGDVGSRFKSKLEGTTS